MKDTQKRFLGAVLAASSVAGIVAPSVTAMATVVDDENNATAEDLKNVIAEYTTKLEANPIFANYHRVQYAADRLAKFDAAAADAAKANIAKYADKVFTKEVTTILDKMDGFAKSKSMATYDALVTKDINAMENKENAAYLMSRLDVWGKGIVFEVDPNYVVATDAIIKVAELRKDGKLDEAQKQAEAAKKAIKEIKTYEVNGAYLEAALKAESDAVENEIANQDLHVTSVTAKNGKEIEVKFNKAVSKDSAEDVKNYTFAIANSDARELKVKEDGIELQDDNKTVVITLSDDAGKTLNNKTNAKYLVTVQNILTDNDDEMDDYSEIVALFDNVKPEVAGLEYRDADTLRVNFSEPVRLDGIYSAIKVKDANGVTTKLPAGSITKTDDDKMYVEMSRSAAGLDSDKTYSLEIDGLTDYAGNALAKYTSNILFNKDTVDPKVEKIEALSKYSFKVTFDEKIDAKDVDGNLYVAPSAGKAAQPFGVKTESLREVDTIEHEKTGDDRDFKTFIVTLKAKAGDAADKKNLDGKDLITISDFKDLSSNEGVAKTLDVKFEESHPVLISTTPTYKTIYVSEAGKTEKVAHKFAVYSFDRDVKVTDALVNVKHVDSDGVTKKEDTDLVDERISDVLDSNEIAVDINKLEEGNYNFDLEAKHVEDKYEQDVEKINLEFARGSKGTKFEVTDVRTKTGDNDKILVTFEKALTKQGILDATNVNNYKVGGVVVADKAEVLEGKTVVELTLKEDSIKTTATERIVEITGIDGVKDYNKKVEGNLVKENERAVLESAEAISFNTIKLTMSEEMDKDAITSGAIEVADNGNKLDIIKTEVNGSVITLTIDGKDPLKNASAVTVKVSDSDDKNMKDLVGNKARAVSDFKVVSNYDKTFKDAVDAVNLLKNRKDDTNYEELLKAAKDAVIKLAEGSTDRINLENEIQAQVDAKAAKDVANAVANINGGSAVLADYTTAKITGVKAENLEKVNGTIKAAREKAGKDLDVTAIQTNVNNTVNVLAEAAKIVDFTANEASGTVVLPKVADGYTVAVKSTSAEDQYGKDGKVLKDGIVNVVYTVTQTSTGLTADTATVKVTVTLK